MTIMNFIRRLPVLNLAGKRPETVRQIRRGEPVTPLKFEPNEVFVIMPFGGEAMQAIFEAIRTACAERGLDARLADQPDEWRLVLDDIQVGIERAQMIICDLTNARPNVYYELGYAHGCGNGPQETLLVAHRDAELHFDVEGLPVARYESTVELEMLVRRGLDEKLEREIHRYAAELPPGTYVPD